MLTILSQTTVCPACLKTAWRDYQASGQWFRCPACLNYFDKNDPATSNPPIIARTNQYRCTRRDPYGPGCPGYADPSARQGHYLYAVSEEEAVKEMEHRFPNDNQGFDIQLWKMFDLREEQS
jgi:hypothetical protein